MPLRFNDTPIPPPEQRVNTDSTQPHGPGNRTAFDFAPVGPGNPKYLTGPPLAELNAIPYRGAAMASHGIDIDTTHQGWEHHASPAEASAGGDGGSFAPETELNPLVVTVVDMPFETEERYSRIIPLFSATENYVFTTVGALDNNPVRTILPKDDTRKSVTILASPSPQGAIATGAAQYAYLISNDQQCLNGVLLGSGLVNSPNQIILLGKSPVFARLVPLAAYDNTKTNNYSLVAISETNILGSKRVS